MSDLEGSRLIGSKRTCTRMDRSGHPLETSITWTEPFDSNNTLLSSAEVLMSRAPGNDARISAFVVLPGRAISCDPS